MTIRYYILPIVVNPIGARRPAYFKYRGDTDVTLLLDPWSLKDYGSINEGVLCSNITAADHTSLVAHADVLAIPTNIDSTLTAGAVTTAKSFLETYNVPAGWINTGDTYRATLRTITAFFLYVQSVTALVGHDIVLAGGWSDLQYQQLPADIQAAMLQAAVNQGFNTSGLQPTTTVRVILKFMADAWANRPILFGLATL